MSGRKLRWLTAGLVASGGAGLLALTSMMNSAYAFGDAGVITGAVPDITVSPNPIGLVMGGSGLPIPGPGYVAAANGLYIDNPLHPNFPGTIYPPPYSNGLFTPEGLYPLTGVHTLFLNYPQDANGLPDLSTSVGQGATILENSILSNAGMGDPSTVFGYSQSSTLSGITMKMLDPSGTPDHNIPAQFLLIADPSAPNGGLLERFNGFETVNGDVHSLPLNLPSLGLAFDGATPSNDFPTDMYSLEYDGFTDFPRYPLNFLADLNAFLGIQTLHGTYLNFAVNGTGPTPQEIAGAHLLPGSALLSTPDSLTNYYMIDETPPLVSALPQPLQALLGPDLTYLINLGYGDGTLGYSLPANVATPFGLFPSGVTLQDVLTNLSTDTQQGITAFEHLMSNPAALVESAPAAAPSLTDVLSTLTSDFSSPTAAATSFTDIVNAITTASSAAYSTLLPLTDIGNALATSVPAYDLSLFTTNLANGDLTDAFGLPVAANTALDTLAAGFAIEVVQNAASQIQAAFAGLF